MKLTQIINSNLSWCQSSALIPSERTRHPELLLLPSATIANLERHQRAQVPDLSWTEKTRKLTLPRHITLAPTTGNIITHVVLKGDNYVAWVRAITLSLKA